VITRPVGRRKAMKPLEEILCSEEKKWRGRSFEEIEGLHGEVQCYSVPHDGANYHFEIHTEKSKNEMEILVRVECSKNMIFGKAKYFAVSADHGVRDIADEEAF
jgi:hypothetical protein